MRTGPTPFAIVADDNLLDLDFTSFVPPPPAPEPEPVRAPVADIPVAEVPPPLPAKKTAVPATAAQPAAPAPLPAAKYPVMDCPAALREAAALYAQGKDIEASRCLETAIKRNAVTGDAALRVWLALFEVLQSLGRKPAFETLALAYARTFGLSPPAWVVADDVASGGSSDPANLSGISLAGALTAKVGEVLKQAMKLAQSSAGVSMDLAKATDIDNDAATLIMRAHTALRKAGKACVFAHPLPLAKTLNTKLLPGQRENEALWLLQIELYQQGYDKAAFEDAAVGYAVTFEVSPPSYVDETEDMHSASTRKNSVVAMPPTAANADLALQGDLQGQSLDDFAYLTTSVQKSGEETLAIDASTLRRIDAPSADALAKTLETLNTDERRIRLTGLTQLVAAYLASTAVAQQSELVLRRI